MGGTLGIKPLERQRLLHGYRSHPAYAAAEGRREQAAADLSAVDEATDVLHGYRRLPRPAAAPGPHPAPRAGPLLTQPPAGPAPAGSAGPAPAGDGRGPFLHDHVHFL